jgi:hypothetical protein
MTITKQAIKNSARLVSIEAPRKPGASLTGRGFGVLESACLAEIFVPRVNSPAQVVEPNSKRGSRTLCGRCGRNNL